MCKDIGKTLNMAEDMAKATIRSIYKGAKESAEDDRDDDMTGRPLPEALDDDDAKRLFMMVDVIKDVHHLRAASASTPYKSPAAG